MGRISENPVSAWKENIDWFVNSSQCRELDRIDGEPMEFEWTIFPGFTTLQILAEIQNMMTELQCEAGVGVSKARVQQAAAGPQESRACVCANILALEVAHAGGEGRINVLPWYRVVGVAKYLQRDARREDRDARKRKWPPRGTGMTVLTYPGMRPGEQARLVKTVNIQVEWAPAHRG